MKFTFCIRLFLLGSLAFALLAARVFAQTSAPNLVEVYWQDSRTVPFPGVTGVTVIDDSICRAQALTDKVQFLGISRGETAAFVWINDQRLTVRIRVVLPPDKPLPPHLSQSELDALGNGFVGSSMQAFIDPQGHTDYIFLHNFDWQQQFGADRLVIHALAQDATTAGTPGFNANSLSILYTTPHRAIELGDFPLTLDGGLETKIGPYSSYNMYEIRGADYSWKSGQNLYEFFGGTTIPPYYLTLSSTRDVAGFNFSRKESGHLLLYTTTGWVNAPFENSASQFQRANSFFQTAGVVYRPSHDWALQASAGASTRGALAQGTAAYTTDRLSAFVAATKSSPGFPINQLQLFFAGGSSISGGATLRLDSRIAGSLYYQHSDTQPTIFFPISGKSDYLNPNLTVTISQSESVTLNYAYTRNNAGLSLTGRNQGHRLDVLLNSRLPRRTSNTAELTVGALSDPLQLNSAGSFVASDAFAFPVRAGYITLGFQHTRQDPSLVNRLYQEINLLPPALQQIFLSDPLAFVNSPELDPALRALLQNLQPTNTEFTLNGQFRIRDRLDLSPNVAYFTTATGLGHNTDSKLFGYTLSYALTPTFRLTSSLSDVLFLDSQTFGVRRTTVLTVGFNKALRGTSRLMLPFHPAKRTVNGRVFRDLNVNGAWNQGKPGLPGVRVDLSNAQSVRTDAQGFYEFTGLRPDTYRVSVPLNQFTEPIRVTTPAEASVQLIEDRSAEVNFGIVNFARLMGNVFNDYRLDGTRQPDANGVRGVKLTLTGNGTTRHAASDGGGDFEFYEIPPGDYQLTLDRSTLPAGFIARTNSADIHVDPTATVIQDMPVQALRSVSGHVYFRPAAKSATPGSANAALQPLAGIQLTIDHTAVTSAADGSFVLRNLPADTLTLTLLPFRPLPPSLAVPSGRVKVPREPIQVENATIVISNPELLKYLLPPPAPSAPARP